METITLDEALGVADAISPPYAGDRKSAPAVKAFLQSNHDKIKVKGSDGLDIDLKSVEIQEDTEIKSVTLPTRTAKAAGTTEPADLNLKLKAMLEQAIASDVKSRRPGGLDPEKPVIGKVIGSEERKYFDNKTAVFRGTDGRPDYADAKGFAHWLAAKCAIKLGRVADFEKHQRRCMELMESKGYLTTDTASGGALVPDSYDARVIQLVKEYGVARRICTFINMESDTVTRPRVTSDITLYYPAEGSATTASQRTWSNVQLRAKEGVGLVKMSTAIVQDAAIDIAEDTARSMARVIAKTEDDTLFNGTGAGAGTSYTPGIQGVVYMFGTSATADSRSVTGGDTSDAHTRANLITLMSKVPRFVGGMPAWHCSYEMEAFLLGIALAQGAADAKDFQGLGMVNTVFGRPVIPNNVMNLNSNTGGDVVDILYGDMSQCAYMGVRGGTQIDTSTDRYFDEANIGIRCIVRHDITVHDLGSTSTQSPVAALYQT